MNKNSKDIKSGKQKTLINQKFSKKLYGLLICPICKKGKLVMKKDSFKCKNTKCSEEYPIKNNTPILINEKNSIFLVGDFLRNKITTIKKKDLSPFKGIIRKLIPKISSNISSEKNYINLSNLISRHEKKSNVLVIGAGNSGFGIEILSKNKFIKIINSDVSFGLNTNIICDAHDLPFRDNSFDAIICQAVLEHVADPYRCVDEIYRVLKPNKFVYIETPFMQQVHMAPYDFTRFTYLGHRRLFRRFKEIDSGIACGPGMSLAWAYRYFLLSFFESKIIRKIIKVFSSFTSFFLGYFDNYLLKKSGSYDAASSYYFMGQKSNKIISDRDLVKMYKGAGR